MLAKIVYNSSCMKNLFNQNFFHFVFGFIMVLLLSFGILFTVNYFMQKSIYDAQGDLPESTCITSTGEAC